MLGVIADDLTGATDIASVLDTRGFTTVVIPALDGLPDSLGSVDGCDAIVVALKSRTVPVDRAVFQSQAAFALLRGAGATRYYFKFCSTFDSTPEGNIGPVIDALLDETESRVTIVSPAYPETGRTVYQSYLFVGDVLLERSAMRWHPLTPMTESDLRLLLRPQSRSRIESIALTDVRGGVETLRGRLTDLASESAGPGPIAAIVDAVEAADLATIANAASDLRLVTGSAGLAAHFPSPRSRPARMPRVRRGRRLILSGSSSAATRAQVAVAQPHLPSMRLNVGALTRDPAAETDRLVTWVRDRYEQSPPSMPVLIYSSGPSDPPVVSGSGQSDAVERCLAAVARTLASEGAYQILVAGGETSGAVVRDLGIRRLAVETSIAPGVPWMSGDLPDGTTIDIVLKSGNFGGSDVFLDAWDRT